VIAVRQSLFPDEPGAILVRRLLSDIMLRRPLVRLASLCTRAAGATYLS
jgi:hypothetical protein